MVLCLKVLPQQRTVTACLDLAGWLASAHTPMLRTLCHVSSLIRGDRLAPISHPLAPKGMLDHVVIGMFSSRLSHIQQATLLVRVCWFPCPEGSGFEPQRMCSTSVGVPEQDGHTPSYS